MRGKPEDEIFERMSARGMESRELLRSSSRSKYDNVGIAQDFRAGANTGNFFVNSELSDSVSNYTLTTANQLIK
jgi:hypothetical protein